MSSETKEETENMGKSHAASLKLQYLKIAGVVTLYWAISITTVFMNKHLLSGNQLEAPFFITWYQCVVSVAICGIMSTLAHTFPKTITFPEFAIEQKISREVLPLSLVFVGMISFNNLCLKYVGVAFYYVGRSLTTVFNVICTYLILHQKTSIKAIGCCGLIIMGFFLGVDQEDVIGTLSVVGVVFGVLASLAVALNSIYTKKVLPVVSANIWRLAMYNNFNAVFLFLPLMLFNGELSALWNYEHLYSAVFWALMTTSGVLGFLMSYVTGLQIQVASPLTHNISGTAKAAFQTLLAVLYFHDVKPFLWWISNLVVLVGSLAYTYVRMMEMKSSDDRKNTVLPRDKVPLIRDSEEEL